MIEQLREALNAKNVECAALRGQLQAVAIELDRVSVLLLSKGQTVSNILDLYNRVISGKL